MTVFGIAIVSATAWSSERYLAQLRAPSTAALRLAGDFVATATRNDDFVLYARPKADDNPAFLYFAQRRGANVVAGAASAELEREWLPFGRSRGGRLVWFVPADCSEHLAPALPWLALATGAAGTLYRLDR